MKTAQWVAVLGVSAGIVFGLTFAVNYLGGRGGMGNLQRTAPRAELTWVDGATNFPANPTAPPAECEIGFGQSHDFWFKNENKQPLPVGVFSKTCQCTSVLLWLAPTEWKDVPAADDRARAMKVLEAAGSPADELKDKTAAVIVPAGAVGVVRLAWKGDRAGQKDLAAELWMGEKGPGPTHRFLIRTVFIGPIKVAAPEIDVGDLPLDKLPYKLSFKCWSSTRDHFPLDVSVFEIQHRLKSESNPFVVGKPVPLTETELASMRKDRANGVVLAGYTIPVTLLKESKDKTPFDVGIFRQRIQLKTKGADPNLDVSIQVGVHGTILGDLTVVGDDPGPVKLGSFYRNQDDVRREVLVESGANVTALELDRPRTPDFLGVAFSDPPEKIGGRKTWRLQVKWLPQSQAGGAFPRDEDEYRDSAVYIRPVYATPGATQSSCLRIPVVGKADTAP